LIAIARPLYASDPIHVDLDQMHTLLDLHGNIPTFIYITEGRVHDVNILDEFLPEAGAFYVMDRGYIDFERLFVFTLCSAFFVVRTKENVLLLGLEKSLYQILQIFSITSLEKVPSLQVFEAFDSESELLDNANQLILFDL
jgi:hypothetical protein